MMGSMNFKEWIKTQRQSVMDDYFTFLRFPSISADPEFKEAMLQCSRWLAAYLQKHTTLKIETIATPGYPLVYGEDLSAGPNAKTVLIYGHYDVQPVDPLELWVSPPFEPTIREGKIYARGAVDDKGQIFYAISALRALKEGKQKLPVNIKLCIEGEEESASLGLGKALASLQDKLKADALFVIDFDQFDQDTPAMTLSARGMVTMEVTLTGSHSDLHSGIHGGLAYNPNKALVQLLAQLWKEDGSVAVEGFYEDVVKGERGDFAFKYTEESYKKQFGVGVLGGEKGRSLFENNCLRPVLEINGIAGGYAGAGFKTVIPAKARAKLSCRLVPNQDPVKVGKQIAHFLQKHVVDGMKIEVSVLDGAPSFRGKADSFLAKAFSEAAHAATGKACKNILGPASIPIVAAMMKTLRCDVVGMGYGLPTDNIHAPNEHFDWTRFEKGFVTVAETLIRC